MYMAANQSLNNQYLILTDTLNSLIEDCKLLYNKLKNSIYKKSNFEFLNQINASLNKISIVLFENKDIYSEEFKTFAKIKKYIIYIVGKNCENNDFGHINCVKHILEIFLVLINQKFELLYENISLEDYERELENTSHKLYDFRMYFNDNIFDKDHKFDKDIEKLNSMLTINPNHSPNIL